MKQAPAAEDQILEALAKVPVFSQLDDRSLRKLARLCTVQSFEAGDGLYQEGAMGLGLFIVTSGQVERYKTSGEKKVSLGTVAPGGMLGQLALIDEQPRSASAAALESSECLLLTRDSFATLVKRDPQIAWCLTPDLAKCIRDLQGQTMTAELARQEADTAAAAAAQESARARAAEAAADDEDDDEDDDGASDLELALFKVMRMQYGVMAGTAKGMTETARAIETFLTSMADETDFKTQEDWRDLMSRIPDAMVTATRAAMKECEKVPEEVLEAYRRYGESG